MLLSAHGVGTMEIMRRTGVSNPTVWRWQRSFMEAGLDGPLRDKTRPPGKKPLPPDVVKACLAKHSRFHMHFTPTSASWLNLVERFFAELTEKRIRRGTFHSLVTLHQAINDDIAKHNADPKPFVWTASAHHIIDKVTRGKQALDSGH